jgi:hypothetical protein
VFIPGLELSRRFYVEAVRRHLGDLPHTAARVGAGSEVLGFDTPRSADHEWGPRLQVFLRPADARRHAGDIVATLSAELPKSFHGYPTNFGPGGRVRSMTHTDGPVFHRVDVTSLDVWFAEQLGFDPRAGVTTHDWLSTPTQTFAEVTAGEVYHDELGLDAARADVRWYPDDVWRHVLACQWQRLSQEEAFVGRCGEVGDEVGSAVVAARQVRDLMRLRLLMRRRYPPYSKWLGSAYAQLAVPTPLMPVLTAATWRERETHLAAAYTAAAEEHNRLGLTAPLDPSPRPYHDRPFQVLHAERFVAALVESVRDQNVRGLPLVGAIDQVSDNTDLLADRNGTRHVIEALTS